MKFFKILPAAAGVIALTAAVSFARDDRECEEDGACRTVVAVRGSTLGSDIASSVQGREGGEVYQVKVMRGNRGKLVLIDAYTGKVIDKSDLA